MNAPSTPMPEVRSRWGRSRLGGGSASLLSASALLGLLIAAGVGALLALTADTARPLLPFVIGALVTLPTATSLVWALLVDRSTLSGAVDRPEESIESAWYGQAATGALADLIMVLGLGAAAFSLTRVTVDSGALLIVLFTLVAVDFGGRYWAASREGR